MHAAEHHSALLLMVGFKKKLPDNHRSRILLHYAKAG
jgi:hypothetical protein